MAARPSGFKSPLPRQVKLWGNAFEGRVVVEKLLKTPADGSPGMGRRYGDIIERLKAAELVREGQIRLPRTYNDHYSYKRGNEVYWRAARAMSRDRDTGA